MAKREIPKGFLLLGQRISAEDRILLKALKHHQIFLSLHQGSDY